MKLSFLSLLLLFSAFHCAAGEDISKSKSQSSSTMSLHEPDSLSRFLGMLGSEHGGERSEAIAWLGRHPAESRAPLLQIVLEPGKEWAASAALQAIAQFGEAEDLPFLVGLARERQRLAWDAAAALAVHPSPEALAALIDMANWKEEELAGNALVALGMRGGAEARLRLEEALAADSAYLRWKAVHGLGLMGPDGSRQALADLLLSEPDSDVRSKLVEVLAEE